MLWPWQKQKNEKRSGAFTSEMLAARYDYIAGRRGLGELTATVATCATHWSNGLSLADVDGSPELTASVLAMIARACALRGEAVFLIGDRGLIAAHEWDVSTKDGEPVAYRLSIAETGGGYKTTALAGEVLHVRIGCDPSSPWLGQSPLKRAALSAGLLNAVESALVDIYETAPLGSLVLPIPETPNEDAEILSRGFRGRRGSVLLRESTNVMAAGGPAPQSDWRPAELTPDLQRILPIEALNAARDAICSVYGVLPCLLVSNAQGPSIREAQRHLAQWQLQPLANAVAEEASRKLGGDVRLDVLRPLQAFDAGGRARAFAGFVSGLAEAKAAGLSDEQIAGALKFLDVTPVDYRE